MTDLEAVRDHRTEVAASRSATRAPVVVVGLGNDIASDDGVGIRVAGELRTQLAAHPEIEVVALPWAGFALLDVLRGRRRAVLVDCLVSGRHAPGTIVRLDPADIAGSVRLNSFHDIDYGTALDLGRAMGWKMPNDVAIWAVEAANATDFGEALSPGVAAAVAETVDQIIDHLGVSA